MAGVKAIDLIADAIAPAVVEPATPKPTENGPALRTSQSAYKIGAITYLPHYRHADRYVGPGYGLRHLDHHSSQELLNAGAERVQIMLMTRNHST